MSNIKLAILGYNTDAGKALFDKLEREGISIEELYPLSYGANEFDAVSLLGKNYSISDPNEFDFTQINTVLFFGNGGDARKLIPAIKETGALVIDATMLNNTDTPHLYLNGFENSEFDDAIVDQHIIPMNSSATMLALLLKPLAEEFGLNGAVITLMEAVSGLGEEGASELARETIALLNMHPIEPRLFSSQIAFNMHTSIGEATEEGATTHENEIQRQLQLVLGDTKEGINLTCVVAPIFYGHTASITFSTEPSTSIADIKELMSNTPGIELVEDEEVTPAKFGINEDHIIVSRLRADSRRPGYFSFVAVMDNARIGIASNCVGILRNLLERS